jgi:5'-nucleotidase
MTLIVQDEYLVSQKISFFKNHHDQFHVVVDFDATLTQYFDHNGTCRPSIISLLRDEWILDEDYTKQTKAWYAYYMTIEHDPTLWLDMRQGAMDERRSKHKELLMHKWLNHHHLEEITSMDRIVMRPGTDILLQRLYALHIPVIIFSASGIGYDSIGLLLKHRWLNFPNISVVSNKLYRNDQGAMIGYSKPVIHSLNKTESIIWDTEAYSDIQRSIADRSHVIVIGDALHDADMVDDRPDRTLLKIWLCNDRVDEKLPRYREVFDIIITNDDSFGEMNTIVWL